MRIASRQYRDAAQLAELEGQLAGLPDSATLLFERACALEDLGWAEAAAAAYTEILEREPSHLGARTNLGSMLHERGDLAGAHALFARAAEQHPFAPIAHANLAKLLVECGEGDRALAAYARALELEPENFAALHGLALAHEARGDVAAAEAAFARAFADRAWWTIPYTGAGTPLRVLLLVSGRGGDLVAHPFLDDRFVETTMLVPDGVRPGTPLPAHDVVFNGIGDADRCRPTLERALAIVATASGTINAPARVLETGRVAIAERLGRIAGVVVPRMQRAARGAVDAGRFAAAGWNYPLLLRSFGHHAGRHLVRADDADGLAPALANVPGDDVLALSFVDTRGADGSFRKYRVLFVGGEMLPVHLAIARDWKVHYFSADMAHNAEHRAEEARFLADPRRALGASVVETLAVIGRMLALDYGGVDFAVDAAGRVVVFEANATMAIAPPEPDPKWAYRQAAYDAAVVAVRALLLTRAGAAWV
jgi:tetratricopeptide (TPR) repeat protein